MIDWNGGRRIDTDVALHLLKGQLLLRRADWDPAGREFERALALSRDPMTLAEHADYLLHLTGRPGPHDLGPALADADAASRADPPYGRAHQVRGSILSSMGRAAEALDAYDAAIRAEPRAENYHWERARVHRDLGRIEEAEAGFAAYVNSDPGNNIAPVVRKLRRLGYFLEEETPNEMTPALTTGLQACARDRRCW